MAILYIKTCQYWARFVSHSARYVSTGITQWTCCCRNCLTTHSKLGTYINTIFKIILITGFKQQSVHSNCYWANSHLPTTSVWKMTPSWHWTSHSGGYWQQAMHRNDASRTMMMIMKMMMMSKVWSWFTTTNCAEMPAAGADISGYVTKHQTSMCRIMKSSWDASRWFLNVGHVWVLPCQRSPSSHRPNLPLHCNIHSTMFSPVILYDWVTIWELQTTFCKISCKEMYCFDSRKKLRGYKTFYYSRSP